MKNGMLRATFTWLLIASPVWWMSGCYSMREIEKPSDAGKADIEVSAKGGIVYRFDGWTLDSVGTIKGHATWSAYDLFRGERKFFEGQRSMPKDSIQVIRIEEFSTRSTLLAGGAVLAALALLVYSSFRVVY